MAASSRKITNVVLAVPLVGVGQVLLRTAAVGICGTDIEVLSGKRPGLYVRYPVVLGHEWSAIVVEVGPGVTGLRRGHRVVVAGLSGCGHCARCRDGQPNLCQTRYEEIGFTSPGGLAGLLTVPADQVYAVPKPLNLDEAALLEPAAVVCEAITQLGDIRGARVAVVGDGTLGQLGVQASFASGAKAVSLIGLNPWRVALARRFGAEATVALESDRRIPEDILGSPDVVIETAGSADAVAVALKGSRRGGRVALIGLAGSGARLTVESDVFVLRAITVHGICGATPRSWQRALELAGQGAFQLAPLITHRFPMSEVGAAFRHVMHSTEDTLKVLIIANVDEDAGKKTQEPPSLAAPS
jgi:2-desacetyl-2-hydroxyethyl bacteriochlorophyllide A dehydrogenase